MKCKISNVLTLENASEDAKLWALRELTLPNPDYAKKLRMGFWTGGTPQKIALYQQRGDTLILPFGLLRSLPECITENAVFERCFKPVERVNYGEALSLYEYQEKAVKACLAAHYGILLSPAGSGKTEMAIALVKALGERALFLTHTIDLLNQAKNRAIARGISKQLIGTITGGKVNIGAGVTFATVQTMSKLDLADLRDEWGVVICDEVHRAAGSPTATTQFYRVLNALSAPHKYGLTATAHRSDGMMSAVYALVGDVIHEVSKEAVGDKVVRVGIMSVATGIRKSRECINTDGTINYVGLLGYLASHEDRTALIGNAIRENKGMSSLILSDRLAHLKSLIQALPPAMLPYAALIHGQLAKQERERLIADMRSGKKKYLFATYSLAKEGLDIPCLERLFLTTPHKDYAVITQSIGRIARRFESKCNPIAYDFVDDIDYCLMAYKKRRVIYAKNDCYEVTEGKIDD